MDPTQLIESNYTFTKESKYTPIGSNARIIQGMDRTGLYQLFAKLGYKVGCEIGLEQGRNALEMCVNIPGLKIYGVDPYKQHPQASYVYDAELRHWDEKYLNKMKAKALAHMEGQDFTLIEKFSEDAARDIPDNSLDFAYIDADHSYDFVMQDIILWGRKVKKGGILSGHDYFYNKDRPGRRAKVTQAVDDYTRVHGINFYITNEDHYEKRGDFYPSWFWVKISDVWPNVVGF